MGETNNNMVEKIKDAEELAQKIVLDAKNSATSLIEDARIKANNLVKTTRQTCFNEWREKVHDTEVQAGNQVAKLIDDATKDKNLFFESGQKTVTDVANWLANEVIISYGN